VWTVEKPVPTQNACCQGGLCRGGEYHSEKSLTSGSRPPDERRSHANQLTMKAKAPQREREKEHAGRAQGSVSLETFFRRDRYLGAKGKKKVWLGKKSWGKNIE